MLNGVNRERLQVLQNTVSCAKAPWSDVMKRKRAPPNGQDASGVHSRILEWRRPRQPPCMRPHATLAHHIERCTTSAKARCFKIGRRVVPLHERAMLELHAMKRRPAVPTKYLAVVAARRVGDMPQHSSSGNLVCDSLPMDDPMRSQCDTLP